MDTQAGVGCFALEYKVFVQLIPLERAVHRKVVLVGVVGRQGEDVLDFDVLGARRLRRLGVLLGVDVEVIANHSLETLSLAHRRLFADLAVVVVFLDDSGGGGGDGCDGGDGTAVVRYFGIFFIVVGQIALADGSVQLYLLGHHRCLLAALVVAMVGRVGLRVGRAARRGGRAAHHLRLVQVIEHDDLLLLHLVLLVVVIVVVVVDDHLLVAHLLVGLLAQAFGDAMIEKLKLEFLLLAPGLRLQHPRILRRQVRLQHHAHWIDLGGDHLRVAGEGTIRVRNRTLQIAFG